MKTPWQEYSAVAWSYSLRPVIPRCNRENNYLENTYGLITPEVSACGFWIPRSGFCLSFQWTVGCRSGLSVHDLHIGKPRTLNLLCNKSTSKFSGILFFFFFFFVFWQITIRLCLRVRFRANGFLVQQLNCQVAVQSAMEREVKLLRAKWYEEFSKSPNETRT